MILYSLIIVLNEYHLDVIRDHHRDAAMHEGELRPLAPARACRGNAEGGPFETLPEVFVIFLLKVSGAFAGAILVVLPIGLQNTEIGVVGVIGGFGKELD